MKTVSVSLLATIPVLPPISDQERDSNKEKRIRKKKIEESTKSGIMLGERNVEGVDRSRTITGSRCILGSSSCNREDVIR